jgi:cell pole-organizing protein PopZ
MGEIKIIIWIVLGIIYIISRARKKPTPDTTQKPVEDYSDNSKPVSFEELLKEIQGAKAPKAQPQPVIEPVGGYKTDYDENLKDEKEPLERTDYNYKDHDTIYETYEKAKQEAFYRPSMEETLKLENTIVRFGQFKGYEQQMRPSLARDFGKDLQDRNSFRKAFILSEILNRRF